tara:strand:- start:2486 stop:2848 length:363 start_codon:yes stop_codon:yes gene_type:complete
MRPIHFFAFFSLFSFGGAALAVDYVQCEAMEKAYSRASASAERAKSNARIAYERSIAEIECGKEPQIGKPAWTDYQKCKLSAVYSSQAMKSAQAAGNKAMQEYQPRLEKIQKDFQDAGCF